MSLNRSRAAAEAKAAEVVERLSRGRATDLGRATGAELVGHYLDPRRRPPRVEAWSERHRDEQARYCKLYVDPVIGEIPCRRLTRRHFQRILDTAPTAWVAAHLRRVLTSLVAAALEEGYLLPRQDVLSGVRWAAPAGRRPWRRRDGPSPRPRSPPPPPCTPWPEPATERSGVWWQELEILFVAYTGLPGAASRRPGAGPRRAHWQAPGAAFRGPGLPTPTTGPPEDAA